VASRVAVLCEHASQHRIEIRILVLGGRVMLDEMEPHSRSGVGLEQFAECLRHFHDGHKGIALAHIRRALKAEPQNPFYLFVRGHALRCS